MILNVEITDKTIGAKHLFKGLVFTIEKKGKVALIGRNGVGKTTLFNILSGSDNLFTGEINKKRDLRLVATQQEFLNIGDETCIEYIRNFLPDYSDLKKILDKYAEYSEMNDEDIEIYSETLERFSELGYYDVENMIQKSLNNFGITEEQANLRFKSLSGGQKRFADLVRVELSNADLALIDEPTNHMDYVGKEAFIKWLKNTSQAVAIITHDRDILANVDRIIEVKDKKAFVFPGNYDAYLQQNGSTTVNQIGNYETAQRTLKKLQKQVIEARTKKYAAGGDSAKRFRTMEDRLQREYDKLKAATKKPTFWVDQETVAEMPDKVVEKYEKYKTRNIKIHKHGDNSSFRSLLAARGLSLGYKFPLFKDINFDLSSGDRIEIKGRNGAGKTTLIKAILEKAAEMESSATTFAGEIFVSNQLKVGFYEQEIDEKYLHLTLNEAIMQTYKDKGVPVNEQKAKQILSDYLFDPKSDGNIEVKNLSGGQKARLQIIKMLCNKPNLLILDEPTNHLDLPSIEELEKSLIGYDGAILYVSHDSFFTRNLGGDVLEIKAK